MAYFDADMDMDAEQVPIVDRMDTEYKVYVNSLPVELNEDAIRDIFGQYGKVTGVFHLPNAIWGYVMYGTYREAELAIRELNNKKPLYLKVTLARERSSIKEEQKSNVSGDFEKSKVVNVADSPSTHNIKYQSMGRGQSMNAPRKHAMPQMTLPYRYPDCGSLASSEIDDHYANTNELWTRGLITVTGDGKRHVSLGRGYTLYEYPEPFPKVEECISKIYEQRNSGLYEYSENKFKNGVQSCSVCSTKTTKRCEKCHTYYCSKACQLEDWPQHQAECERIPALVEETVNGISSLQIKQDENQTKKITSNDVKLRRPNALNAMQAENSSNTSPNINKNNADVTYSNNIDTRDRHSSAQRDNDINVSQTKMADQSVVNAANTKEFSQHRLRRYNNTNENTNQSRKNNECSSTSSSTDQSRHSRNYQSNTNKASVNKESFDNSNVKNRTYNNKNHPQRNGESFQSDKDSVCYNRENISREENNASNNSLEVNNDVAFYKDTHLSKTKFITVEVVIPLNNGEYWIQKLDDTSACMNLMVELQDVAKKLHNIQPIVGEVYGVLYETIWHRAMVTSLNPTKVHFIDFGNDETLEKAANIKDIGNLTKAPKYARKIRMHGTSDKYMNLQRGEKISVRMLSVDSEKTIIVEVQEQSESSSSHTMESASNNAMKKSVPQKNSKVPSPNENTKASTIQIPSILDAFADLLTQKAVSELKIEGFIQFYESTQKNIYSATLSPDVYGTEIVMVFNDLQEECAKAQAPADYKPKAEDLICGKCNDGWYRGYALIYPKTSCKISIITVDEARVLSVDKILPCPKKFLNVCAFGVICEINHSIELEMEKVYDFKAIMNEKSHKQASLKIEISINSEVIQAVVKPWKSLNLSSRPLSEIKNGSKVCFTSYRSHFLMFARSLDEADVEYYNNVMQSVARYAQTAPHLTEPPVSKQIVIAPFEDGNNYRAMVLATQNDKAKIVYIDFGNIDYVDIKDLKVMPQCHLELQQSCSAKIFLKDVPQDIPSNKEVDIYIRNLVGKEVHLVCTYEGAIKDGVRLTMPTGECVNDMINQLLIPGWKKENSDDDKRCYMLNDIEVASLGRVGDTVDALVLFVREDDQTTYMIGPLDFELITHLSDVMPAMLKEYCEKMDYYIPRAEELCLALYDGAWYRAACLNPKESDKTSQILFIDYGNIETVEHKNIRLMPEDFIAPAAIANLCTVVNLAPVDNNGNYSQAVQKKLEELIVPNSQIKIKIIECLESGDYKIELPDVRAALIQHGLV